MDPSQRQGGVSRRLQRAMETMGCKTLAQAARIPYSSWRELPNCGQETIAELDRLLTEAGFRTAATVSEEEGD